MAYNPNNPNGSATSANSAPVVIASDQSAVSVSLAAGRTPYSGSIGATLALIKGSSANLGGWYIYNSNSTVAYVQLFNAASTGAVTLGTTSPTLSLGIPATSGANVQDPMGISFSSGLVIAVTTTRSGSTSPSNTVDYNLFVT